MVDAFVNVTVGEDAEPEPVAAAVAAIEGVAAAHHVRGEYDVVAELDLEDPDSLQRVVTGEIRGHAAVRDTTTVVTPALAAHHTPDAERIALDR
jgi:anthranilate phosphoribosyltransferase